MIAHVGEQLVDHALRIVELEAQMPEEARTAARHCVLDWIGCAIAGAEEPLSEMMRAEFTSASGACSIIGSSARAPMVSAALVNGAAGHALDFDDTNLTMHGHPTAAVLPAVLTMAEGRHSGAEVVTALVVGTEVAVRVARFLGAEHYRRGWHLTNTAGVFGAAVACATLLGLDRERLAMAFGIAGSQAGGLKASFGTMTKPLHAGRAAADGLLAARLAARGFTGNPDVLDTEQGLAEASLAEAPGGSGNLEPDRWFTTETLFKFHAACYGTHATLNATAELGASLPNPAEIERVSVTVAPELLRVCAIPEPRTGLEGKFSLRAATALALLGENTADLGQFTDARMRAPDLVSMRDRVTITTDPSRTGAAVADIEVTTIDGRVLRAQGDSSIPIGDLDTQWERLATKFLGLVGPVLGRDRAAAIIQAVTQLDGPDPIDAVIGLTTAK